MPCLWAPRWAATISSSLLMLLSTFCLPQGRIGAHVIAIKPHHFVDLITMLGDGLRRVEPHPYGHAVHRVAEEILDNPETELVIELGADDICRPCCHNIDGLCDDVIDTSFRPLAPASKREYNLLIDRRWCERLGLEEHDRLTARELCGRIRDCAGDITDIYRETPPERTSERQARLRRGVVAFLGGPVDMPPGRTMG